MRPRVSIGVSARRRSRRCAYAFIWMGYQAPEPLTSIHRLVWFVRVGLRAVTRECPYGLGDWDLRRFQPS